MKDSKISIIVIAYNEEKYLPIILGSLSNQTNKDFEVIVTDSGSSDNTVNTALGFKEKFDALQVVELGCAKGPAYARNKGAEAASYERLIFLDADTRLKNNFIENVKKELDLKKPDVATCPIRISEKDPLSNFGAIFLNVFMLVLKPVYSAAYGACFISTKTVHKKLNGFREDLGICEDCNYIKRARRIYNYKFRILSSYFYTSDRRAKSEGQFGFMFKYILIHLYRMFTGNEILKEKIHYNYGGF